MHCVANCSFSVTVPEILEVRPGQPYMVPAVPSGSVCYVSPPPTQQFQTQNTEYTSSLSAVAYSIIEPPMGNHPPLCAKTESNSGTLVVRYPMEAIIAFGGSLTYNAPVVEEPVGFVSLSKGLPDEFTWTFGDGPGTASGSFVEHSYSDEGTYPVGLSITSRWGGGASTTRSLFVRNVAGFTFSPASPIAGETVQIVDDSLTWHGPTSHSWDLGNGLTSTTQSPTVTYAQPGTYTVTLVLHHGPKDFTKTKTIVVRAPVERPDFSWTPASPGIGESISFTDLTPQIPGNRFWQFNAEASSTVSNPVYAFATPGTKVISLTIGNEQTIKSLVVQPGEGPETDFDFVPQDPDVGQIVGFLDRSTGNPTSWFWSFDDGATSTQPSPSHAFTQARVYNVSLTATNAQGSKTKTRPISVASLPVASFDYSPNPAIVGKDIAFRDTSAGQPNAWLWEFLGDGGTSSAQHPTHRFLILGTHRVRLTVTNPRGQSTHFLDVPVVEERPKADFVWAPSEPVAGASVSFLDRSTGSPTSWAWNIAGTARTVQNPTHTFVAAGRYSVSLTARNATGEDTKTAEVVVKEPEIGALTVQIDLLDIRDPKAGTPVSFGYRSNGMPTTFTWTFGDGGISTLPNPVHTYALPGNYPVTLVVAEGTRAASALRQVTVLPATPPTARFRIVPAAPRIDEVVRFEDESAGFPSEWEWDVYANGTVEGSGRSHTARFSSSGDVLVRLTAKNAAGSSAPLTKSFRVFPPENQPFIKSIKSQYGPCYFGGRTLTTPFRANVDWDGTVPGNVRYKLADGPGHLASLSGTQADFVLSTGTDLLYDPARPVTLTNLSVTATNLDQVSSAPEVTSLAAIHIPFSGFLGAINYEPRRATFTQSVAIPVEPIPEVTFTPPSLVPFIGGQRFGLKKTQIAFENTYATDCTGGSRGQGQSGFLVAGQEIVFNAHGLTDYTISPVSGFLISKTSLGLEGHGVLSREQPLLTMFPGLNAADGICKLPLVSKACSLAKITGEIKLGGGLDYVETFKPDGTTLLKREMTGHLDNSFKLGLKGELFTTNLSMEVFGAGVGTVVFGWPEVLRGFDVGFEAGLTVKAFLFQWTYAYSLKCRLAAGYQFSCFGRPPALLAGAPHSMQRILPRETPHREALGSELSEVVLSDVSPLAAPATARLGAASSQDLLVVLVSEDASSANALQRTDLVSPARPAGPGSAPANRGRAGR